MRALPGLLAGLVLLAASADRNSAATATERDAHAAAEFARRADTLRRDAKIPGLAVVVLRGEKEILAAGFGVTDVATGAPVTPDTPFDIASVTKPISAVVALRLVELGQLDLDRPMRDFTGFPEFRENARKGGGIFFRDFDDDPAVTLTLRHLLGMACNGTPGTRFYYNPVAYSWASRPMAQAGGAPFSELTARLVLRPAGMENAARRHRALPLPAPLADRLARPHAITPEGPPVAAPAPPPQGDGAAGGVIASARDLAQFDRALDGGRLITAESRARMWTPGRTPDGRTLPYALGWFVKEHAGETLLWHTGLWEDAYSALYLKVPARRLTLILLANSDGLRWEQRLDEAAVERSPFVTAFLSVFPR
jgi:CubicO group peptidase (beta-lactamase class C family)